MKYSYARALAECQDPALQLAAIKTAGCDPVFNGDRISGRSRDGSIAPVFREAV
jgi:hypothetical protein